MVHQHDFGNNRRKTPVWRLRRVSASVGGVVGRVIAGFARWRRRQAAIVALRALDDAMLMDIGLHRSQIADAVYRAERGGIARGRPNHEEAEAAADSPESAGDGTDGPETAGEREAA